MTKRLSQIGIVALTLVGVLWAAGQAAASGRYPANRVRLMLVAGTIVGGDARLGVVSIRTPAGIAVRVRATGLTAVELNGVPSPLGALSSGDLAEVVVDAQSGVALRLRAHRQPVLIADDKPSPDPRDKARMEDRSLNGRRVAHRIPSQNTGRDDRHPESPKKKPGDPSQSKDTQDDRNKERAEMKSSPRAPKAAESSTSRGKSRKKMPDDSGPDHHEPDPSDRNPEHQKPEPGDDRPDH